MDPVSPILLLCFECVEDVADQRFSSLTEYWDHLGLNQANLVLILGSQILIELVWVPPWPQALENFLESGCGGGSYL